jgi:hypothetical protein
MQQTRLHLHGGEVAPDYGRSLRLQISEAGLQGTMQADAFKALLAYVTDVQGDRQVMCSILEQLKQGAWSARGGGSSAPCCVSQWTKLRMGRGIRVRARVRLPANTASRRTQCTCRRARMTRLRAQLTRAAAAAHHTQRSMRRAPSPRPR